MEFYMREGEPYLRTSYGIVVCLWDGTVHYLLYLAMASAIIGRRSYRSLGLYWLGSLMMSLLVLLPGNVIGKFGTELRPSFLLNVPYVLLPIWAGMRIFREPRTTVYISPEKALEEQRCGLLQRPLDLALMLYLVIAVGFTLFRGLVVLDCPSDCCFDYIYQYEPYLKDPVAYPKMQMLVYMFYALPVFCLCLYGLVQPGCTWMLDWTLVLAGAIAQAQFSHVGGSLHRRTPYTYRVPAENWWLFLVANVLYALGPHLLAYRCLRNPGFFVSTAPGVQDSDKKQK
ncbi:transmembrane 6 superfamily member 2 isoform X2 [Pleurodeles waltl]